MSFRKRLAGFACIAIGIGVVIGAFGAHKMQEVLSAKQLVTYSTAVRYWFYNCIGLLAIAALGPQFTIKKSSTLVIILGTVVFCFSLWLNALLGVKSFGMIAPIGGLTMVAGWLLTGYSILRSKK